MRGIWIPIWTFVICVGELTSARQADLRPKLWTRGNSAVLKQRFPSSQVRYLDAANEKRWLRSQGYLMPRERDQLLRHLRLDERMAGMDHLAKDAFVMTAMTSTLQELKSLYPRFTIRELRALQTALKGVSP